MVIFSPGFKGWYKVSKAISISLVKFHFIEELLTIKFKLSMLPWSWGLAK